MTAARVDLIIPIAIVSFRSKLNEIVTTFYVCLIVSVIN